MLSILEGKNSEAFSKILSFYAPPHKRILDLTSGKGAFYQAVEEDYDIVRCDLRIISGVDIISDCRYPPFRDQSFDVVVMDPPYQHVGSKRWMRAGDGIFHTQYDKIPTQKYMETLFNDQELERVLKDEGILVVKIMDMIESSKPHWNHIYLLSWLPSFKLEDLLIYVFKPIQDPKWKNLYHARKAHAYFLVFVKAMMKWSKILDSWRGKTPSEKRLTLESFSSCVPYMELPLLEVLH